MGWIRYRADIAAVLLVTAVAIAQLWIFFGINNHWLALGAMALLLPIQTSCGAICHNHHHVNTFRIRWLNRLYECVLYLQTGTSPLSWTIHHNIGHHHDYLDQDKDPAAWQEPDGRLMNRIKFDLKNAFLIYPQIWQIGKQHPVLFRRFKRLLLISNLPLLAFLMIDPVRTLTVFIVPMMLLLIILLDNTYGQHAGTDTDNHYVASRNVEMKLYNLTSWNLGYHTAHHMHPGIHWTQLPALHTRIRDRIPSELIVNTYLLQWEPGRQLRRRES